MTRRLREVVLEALHHYGCPLGHGGLAAYALAEHGAVIAERDLPVLVEAERHAHATGEQREVWVCPTLLADPFLEEGVAVDDSMVTRSDWELSERVLGWEPVRQLWLTREVCRDAGAYLQERQERRPGAELLAEQASMRASLLLPQGEVRARLYLSDDPDAQPPPWEQLELPFRLMLWSEMAEDTFGSLADLEHDLRQPSLTSNR
jgi:hypothetical protein